MMRGQRLFRPDQDHHAEFILCVGDIQSPLIPADHILDRGDPQSVGTGVFLVGEEGVLFLSDLISL